MGAAVGGMYSINKLRHLQRAWSSELEENALCLHITGCRKIETKSSQVFTAGIAVDVQKQLGHIRIAFQIHLHMLLPDQIKRLIGCRGQTSRLEWNSPGLLGVRSGPDQRTWIRSQ